MNIMSIPMKNSIPHMKTVFHKEFNDDAIYAALHSTKTEES